MTPKATERASREGVLVSVIIPCFNQGHFLAEAIESALSQTECRREIVVVDDGSSDDTAAVARRYEAVRYVPQSHNGLAAARNAGFRASCGQFVVFLDSDDRLLPDALGIGLASFAAHPDAGLVYGRCRLIAADHALVSAAPRVVGDQYASLLEANDIWTPAQAMIRRSTLEAVGPFFSGVSACADYDMYLRIARRHPIHPHGEVVAEYRRHGSNMSDDAAMMLRAVMGVLRDERRHVRRRPRAAASLARGRRFWKEFYGERLVASLRQRILARAPILPILRDALTLVHLYPSGFATHVVMGGPRLLGRVFGVGSGVRAR